MEEGRNSSSTLQTKDVEVSVDVNVEVVPPTAVAGAEVAPSSTATQPPPMSKKQQKKLKMKELMKEKKARKGKEETDLSSKTAATTSTGGTGGTGGLKGKATATKATSSKNKKTLSKLENLCIHGDRQFEVRKRAILAGIDVPLDDYSDKSPKGSIDPRCIPIMRLLSNHPQYVTTSSCSGRISIFHMLQQNHHQNHQDHQDNQDQNKDNQDQTEEGATTVIRSDGDGDNDNDDEDEDEDVKKVAMAITPPPPPKKGKKKVPAKSRGGQRWLYVSHEPCDDIDGTVRSVEDWLLQHTTTKEEESDSNQRNNEGQTQHTTTKGNESHHQGNIADDGEIITGVGADDGGNDHDHSDNDNGDNGDNGEKKRRGGGVDDVAVTVETVHFKFEPFVMHVQCKTIEAAHDLLTAVIAAGYRNSGMLCGGKIMVGVRHTAGMNVPLLELRRELVRQRQLGRGGSEGEAKQQKSGSSSSESENNNSKSKREKGQGTSTSTSTLPPTLHPPLDGHHPPSWTRLDSQYLRYLLQSANQQMRDNFMKMDFLEKKISQALHQR